MNNFLNVRNTRDTYDSLFCDNWHGRLFWWVLLLLQTQELIYYGHRMRTTTTTKRRIYFRICFFNLFDVCFRVYFMDVVAVVVVVDFLQCSHFTMYNYNNKVRVFLAAAKIAIGKYGSLLVVLCSAVIQHFHFI